MTNHNNTLSIAAIFRNEAPYLKEWIEYHRAIGVDHFFLYNNESSDDFQKVLAPYIQNKIVTLTYWPDQVLSNSTQKPSTSWVYYTQVPAYEHACLKSINKTDYLAIIDIDEFMVPAKAHNMKELLCQYKEAPGIMLSWQLYGTSDVQALEPNQLLIETLTKTESSVREKNIDIVKSIIKPELYRYFRWMPHECIFQNGQVAVLLDKKEGRINHYVNRTIEYFFQHKLAKKQHMENRLFTDEEIENFLHIGNDEEDSEFLISRFIPEVRRRMRYE